MAGAQDETVPSESETVIWIKFQKLREENISEIHGAHRPTWVARLGFVDAVDDQAFENADSLRVVHVSPLN